MGRALGNGYREKVTLATKLPCWMIETRDLGLLDETEIVVRAAKYGGVSFEVGRHCDNLDRILETADSTSALINGTSP